MISTSYTVVRTAGSLVIIGSIAWFLWPFTNFLSVNWSQMIPQDFSAFYTLAVPYLALMMGALVLFSRLKQQREQFTILLIFAHITFFTFWGIKELFRKINWFPHDELLQWLMVLLFGGFLVWRFSNSEKVRKTFFIMGMLLFGIALVQLASTILWTASIKRELVQAVQSPIKNNAPPAQMGSKKPNVYYFILDGYERSDNLKKYLNFDNAEFIENMEAQDFHIADKSFSNYPHTRLSVSAMLEMEYIVTDKRPSNVPGKEAYPMKGRMSKVFQKFKELGYAVIQSAEGGPMSIGTQGDDLSKPMKPNTEINTEVYSYTVPPPKTHGSLSQIQLALMTLTPSIEFMQAFKPDWLKQSPYAELPATMKYFPRKSEVPYFLFTHILLPHLPGRYDAECRPIKDSHLLLQDPNRSVASDRAYYLGNLQCANQQIYQSVQKITREDKQAIIYITADHGMWFLIRERNEKRKKALALSGQVIEQQMREHEIDEAFGILNMAKLPSSCAKEHYPSISPVNAFRLIFRCLGEKNLPFLEDRIYQANGSGNRVTRLPIPQTGTSKE